MCTNSHHSHINATLSSIDHEDILPNNLIDSEIILEKIQMISRNHTNIETTISHSFAHIHFHSISHFHVIGTYSCINLIGHNALSCNIIGMSVAIIANTNVVSNSAVGAVTHLSV